METFKREFLKMLFSPLVENGHQQKRAKEIDNKMVL